MSSVCINCYTVSCKKIHLEQSRNSSRTIWNLTDGGIQIIGDKNQVSIDRGLQELAENPSVMTYVENVLSPIRKEGYEKVEFEANGQVSQYITQEEATRIIRRLQEERDHIYEVATALDHAKQTLPQPTAARVASVRVKKPVFEGTSKWTVVHDGRAIDVKVADKEFLEDVQSSRIVLPARSSLVVDLSTMEDGKSYLIEKVYKVVPPPEQLDLLRSVDTTDRKA